MRAFVRDRVVPNVGDRFEDATLPRGLGQPEALLVPYILSAIRMFEQGLASADDIDKGVVEGCAHPMGPLALADLIGLDTVIGVAETLYDEHRGHLFGPPPLLQRLVSAGLLGRKSGRGLCSYD